MKAHRLRIENLITGEVTYEGPINFRPAKSIEVIGNAASNEYTYKVEPILSIVEK